MRNAVLETLRMHPERWIPYSALVERLDADAVSLDVAIEELRREGYLIEADGEARYRLVGCEDRLIPREVQRELGTRVLGRRILCLDTTASTNDVAWAEVLAGAEEGAVVFAEEQTAGRGRLGRSWHSPRGAGLLLSLVLRPPLDVRHSHMLTVMASVAVAESLRGETTVAARIRWPNDIVVRERKVAGILVEGRALASGAAFVLGIGINVNTRLEELPRGVSRIATSLTAEAGRRVSRVALARALLRSIERWYRELCSGDVARIADHWRYMSSTLGQRVLLIERGREYRGTVLDLSVEHGLIVRLDSGPTRTFQPAGVTLRPRGGSDA